MPEFALSAQEAHQIRADAVVVFCCKGDRHPKGLPASALRTALVRAMKEDRFTGKEGELLLWHAPDGMPASRYLVVGMGPPDELDLESVRRALAVATRKLQTTARHMAAALPAAGRRSPSATRVKAAVEGVCLGGHRWTAWISKTKKSRLAKVTLLASSTASHRAAVEQGRIYSDATILARDLTCEAPSTMTPRAMEREARRVAREVGLKLTVLNEARMKKMGMGCLLGVSRGSNEPARLLHLVYKPRRQRAGTHKRVALVGKGVTFDSGGLSLKPSPSMEIMKSDMAGSAAVLGAMSALKALDCPAEVHGIMAMVENMPSGTAYKPGDILKSMSGRTVEVLNTDAEGRLVLADGLEYARRLKPDCIVDLATLTGAVVVALGTLCTGVMGYDQKLVDELLAAARTTGEKFWPLPLIKEYRKLLDSKVADIKHIGSRWGGSLTAGHFLGEFAGKDIPWVHLDIAGPSFAEQDQPLARVGGTGHPVRTLLHWLQPAS
ncbi:MAG: leucyl aminopeptidase [Acidobacteria bacterium]|nr:leucyl aminopeptidase [Acidobacteriota bacterium]